MKTVKQVIEELSKYPEDALCYAYEGELVAIIVVEPGNGKELGYVVADYV